MQCLLMVEQAQPIKVLLEVLVAVEVALVKQVIQTVKVLAEMGYHRQLLVQV
jgi:hypothetical protein